MKHFKNKIILQEKIREKYKDNEEEFFKDLQTTSQTFWKRYDNQKFPTKQIFKAKELLDLTKKKCFQSSSEKQKSLKK